MLHLLKYGCHTSLNLCNMAAQCSITANPRGTGTKSEKAFGATGHCPMDKEAKLHGFDKEWYNILVASIEKSVKSNFQLRFCDSAILTLPLHLSVSTSFLYIIVQSASYDLRRLSSLI